MKSLTKGLAIALLHILIVLSLGGKLLYDRAHRPRVWVKTGSFDPELPIRGRYLTLNLEVHAPGLETPANSPNVHSYDWQSVKLEVENGQLLARPTQERSDMGIFDWNRRPNSSGDVHFLSPPVMFFIPEHAETPRIKSGEELWAEVTIPTKGPPRPIQLAIKRGGEWHPLTYR